MATGMGYKSIGTSVTSPVDNKRRKEVLLKPPGLIGEILELTWESKISAAHTGVKIPAPHWRKGVPLEEDEIPQEQKFKTGSKRPGVYLVKPKNGSDDFKIRLNFSKCEVKNPAGKIKGKLGALEFEGACTLKKGDVVVSMKIKNLPETVAHFEGDVIWKVENSGMLYNLSQKTRLELFVILDAPASLYRTGVWVEALRFLCRNTGVVGIAGGKKAPEVARKSLAIDKSEAARKAEAIKKDEESRKIEVTKKIETAKKITAYCHGKHGVAYDTARGASHFGVLASGGAGFELNNYMKKKGLKGNIVNCYDQAAAVQSLAGALGVNLGWYYMDPYGYINPANLVGVGACNSPFYKFRKTGPLVDRKSPLRTAFGNHAFPGINGKILDACAGPHLATESLREYIRSAIDAEVTVSDFFPGKAASIYRGELEGKTNPSGGLTGVMYA
ncbi:hypothetical protein GNX71_30710 [Variovorax sp. RKNM96]|uniref:hypothetical protein n=1 Tax=Variovorax sp. RKNM96 TaxID=2681552 RepID=UPI00197CCF14|nr:hypothetical protein [Variovorax sp. RKNM96]QSI33702.1 hypothetical protein GNX71_30710 [Variovorax sp. RKNM96]